jgi:hypothetical protein
MNFQKLVIFLFSIGAAIAFVGCTSSSDAQNQNDTSAAIRNLAASLPRKIDAATTLIEVKSDGQGGIINVNAVDTSMVKIPSQAKLKEMLCGVRSDSPPPGNRNPFTSITYIYRDLQGNELTRVSFSRGECPGQGM